VLYERDEIRVGDNMKGTPKGRIFSSLWALISICRRPNTAYSASSARVRSLRSVDIPLAMYSYIAQSMHFLFSLLEPCRASLIIPLVPRDHDPAYVSHHFPLV
jgi:hypothetical protein